MNKIKKYLIFTSVIIIFNLLISLLYLLTNISYSIIILILFILTLLFRYDFNIKNIIYYLLIMLSVIFGSIVSKNIKR